MLKDQVFDQIVLRYALVTYRAIMPVRLSVALEGSTTFWRGQASNRSQKRGHEDQPEEHQTAPKATEEARTRAVLSQSNVLRHPTFAGVAKGVKVNGVGEVFSPQLQEDFCSVLRFIHFDGDEEHAIGVGYAACPTVLVTIHHAGPALNEDVPQHDGCIVAVGCLARDSVGLSAGHGQCKHGQHQYQPHLAHGGRCWLELIKP